MCYLLLVKAKIRGQRNLGVSATYRFGFNTNDGNNTDAENYVFGTDLSYELFNGLETRAEFSHSESKYDLTDSQFKSEFRGNAYYVSLLGRFPFQKYIKY